MGGATCCMAPALGVALTRVIGGSAVFPHRVAAETRVSCLRPKERKRTAELGAHSRGGLIAHVELGAAEVTLESMIRTDRFGVRRSVPRLAGGSNATCKAETTNKTEPREVSTA